MSARYWVKTHKYTLILFLIVLPLWLGAVTAWIVFVKAACG